MYALFARGAALDGVARRYGLTPERVLELLGRHGLDREVVAHAARLLREELGRRDASGRVLESIGEKRRATKARFSPWPDALLRAGRSPHPPRGGQRSTTPEQCIAAVREVVEILGRAPTNMEYHQFARRSNGALPSAATVYLRCGRWFEVLRGAGL